MPPVFEWDERKAQTNLKNHGVSFGEAAFTERRKGFIRIISARRATKRERRDYEENIAEQ